MAFSQTSYPTIPQPTRLQDGEAQDVPYRRTPPWGEAPYWTEEDVGILPHIEGGPRENLEHRIEAPFGHDALKLAWWNDHQYGWPPPGAPNRQPFQSGHTQATVHNFAAEQGELTDPAFRWPRYPHMENHAYHYAWGVARRFGQYEAPKDFMPLWWMTQQARDLTLTGQLAHGPHQVIVRNAESVPNTLNVVRREPFYIPEEIGAEGVPPG